MNAAIGGQVKRRTARPGSRLVVTMVQSKTIALKGNRRFDWLCSIASADRANTANARHDEAGERLRRAEAVT
jgi:hypothetical protein